MPVKWTPENDQLLLLKILETHEISLDYQKVMKAWPTKNGQDSPTARAISERIAKIKNLAKVNNGDVVTTPKKSPAKTTPRKRVAGNASTPGSKRFRTNQKVTDSSEIVKGEYAVKDEPANGVKKEPTEDDNEIIANNPLEDVFGGKRYGESSGSEYAPAPAAPVMPTENRNNGHFMEYA